MKSSNIIAWYLDRKDMSIVPVFQTQDLQRTNGTNKVQKAIWVIDNEVLWASGAIEATQLKMVLAYSAFIFQFEDEARAKRNEFISILDFKGNTNEVNVADGK